MKKVLCAILTAATLLLCACGGTAAPEQTPAVPPAPTDSEAHTQAYIKPDTDSQTR